MTYGEPTGSISGYLWQNRFCGGARAGVKEKLRGEAKKATYGLSQRLEISRGSAYEVSPRVGGSERNDLF